MNFQALARFSAYFKSRNGRKWNWKLLFLLSQWKSESNYFASRCLVIPTKNFTKNCMIWVLEHRSISNNLSGNSYNCRKSWLLAWELGHGLMKFKQTRPSRVFSCHKSLCLFGSAICFPHLWISSSCARFLLRKSPDVIMYFGFENKTTKVIVRVDKRYQRLFNRLGQEPSDFAVEALGGLLKMLEKAGCDILAGWICTLNNIETDKAL